MSKQELGNHVITQIGLVVRDIEKTSQAFSELFGIEKPDWFETDGYDQAQTEYRGQPSEGRAKLAFFDMGSLQLELIEPVSGPSTWQEHLDERGEGVHHIAFVIRGMQDKIQFMAEHGAQLLQRGEYTGGRYAYFDTMDTLKVIVELLENDA